MTQSGSSASADAWTVRTLEPKDWPLVERLFGTNGACGGCWCMWPRVPKGGRSWEENKGAPHRKMFRQLVQDDAVHAVFALRDDEPVGWCSFGPRSDFPRLETVRDIQTRWDDETWSIVCFFIPARARGQGVATRLLEAATECAFALGAQVIEGYPVVPKKDRMPAAFAWTGVPELFRRAGYRAWRMPSANRPVYRLRR